MFRCTNCQVSALPGIKPVIVPAEERVKEYHGYDVEDNPTVTFGQETVREAQLCPGCAGTNVTVPRKPDYTAAIVMGHAFQGHARSCDGTRVRIVKGVKVKEPCSVCARNIAAYASISAPAINAVLSEPQVHTGRLSIAGLVLYAATRRTHDRSKRSSADFQAAFPLLAAYEKRGGGL